MNDQQLDNKIRNYSPCEESCRILGVCGCLAPANTQNSGLFHRRLRSYPRIIIHKQICRNKTI